MRPAPSGGQAHLRRNVVAILTDISGFGTSLGFIGFDTLLPFLAYTLTRDERLVGLIGTVWIGAWLLPQLVVGRWMARRPNKKPVMLGGALISRGAFALFVALLAFGQGVDPLMVYAALIVALVVFRSFDAVAAVAWLDILTKALPMHVRSRVFGAGQALANTLRFGAALVVTFAISSGLRYPGSYVTLFGYALIALTISAVGLLAIREPAEPSAAPLSSRMGFVAHALHVLREDRRFRQITIARLLLGTFDLARPQYAVHATVELGLPPESIGYFTAAYTVGAVFSSVLLGRLSEKRGPTPVICVTTLLGVLIPLLGLTLHLLGHGQAGWATGGYLLLYALLGAIDVSGLLGILAYVLDIAPPNDRPSYTGLSNTITGVVVIMPTLGGIVLQLTSYPVLFACALAGPVLALPAAVRLPPAREEAAAD